MEDSTTDQAHRTVSMVGAALTYAECGFRVHPLYNPIFTDGTVRCSCPRSAECLPRAIGKHPRLDDWPGKATTDPAQIRRWWERWPQASIGIVPGAASGIAIVDVDPRNGGTESLEELQRLYRPFPETPMVLSGGRGQHYYFALDADVPCIEIAPGIDFLADGHHYAIAPPSLHASGRRYAWELSQDLDDTALAPLPDWLIALVHDKAQEYTRAAAELPDELPSVDVDTLRLSARMKRVIIEGNDREHPYPSRSEAGFAVIIAMIQAGYDDATIAAVLLDTRYRISERYLEKKNPRSPNYWALTLGYVAKDIVRGRAKGKQPGSGKRSRSRRNGTGETGGEQGTGEQAAGSETAAPEPLPLYRELPPAEPYPIDALGPILAPMARVLMEVVKAPDALCGQSVLAAAAVAVQAHGNVVIDGRVHPTSAYFVSIAESGDRKTTADTYALYPHRRYERTQYDDHQSRIQTYRNEDEAYRKAREEVLRKAKGYAAKQTALGMLGSPPVAPTEPVFLMGEPTYEGLVKLLQVSRPSVGLFNDEGGRFIYGHGMNPDNQIKTAAGLSDLWDGKPVNRVRAGDATVMLYGRRLSVHLMAQPKVALHLLGSDDLLDQGLLSRCLVAWPTSLAGTRTYRAYDLTQDPHVQQYNTRMQDILATPLPLEKDAETGRETRILQPHPLVLSAKVKRRWEEFYDHVEHQLGEDGELTPVQGFGSKLGEHALRLAGILTLVGDIKAREIGPEQMEAGITLAEFYATEALRIFGHAAMHPDLDLAGKLLKWAWGQPPDKETKKTYVYLKQIYQYGPGALREAKTAKQIVSILEDHRWLVRVEGGMKLDEAHRRDVWEVQREESR